MALVAVAYLLFVCGLVLVVLEGSRCEAMTCELIFPAHAAAEISALSSIVKDVEAHVK